MAGWVLLVFATTVYGISRISEPDFKAVNFAKAREGRRLNSSVIKAMNVDSEGACRLQCVALPLLQLWNHKEQTRKVPVPVD